MTVFITSYVVSIAFRLFTIAFIFIKSDPVRIGSKLQIVHALVTNIFYLAWFIYANTFHWSDESYECRDLSYQTFEFWRLVTLLMFMGYLMMMTSVFAVCLLVAIATRTARHLPQRTLSNYLNCNQAMRALKIK